MTLAIVRVDDVAPSRWRNGGGWTRELIAWPKADDWTLRISVADIESSGPFSMFARVDRWFAVLSGAGVELATNGGTPIVLGASDPLYAFAGDAPTECRLVAGTTRDFNLMIRRDRARVRIADLSDSPLPAAHASWAGCFTAHAGRVRVASGDWQALPPLSLAWLAAPIGRSIEFEREGHVRGWWIELHDAGATGALR